MDISELFLKKTCSFQYTFLCLRFHFTGLSISNKSFKIVTQTWLCSITMSG